MRRVGVNNDKSLDPALGILFYSGVPHSYFGVPFLCSGTPHSCSGSGPLWNVNIRILAWSLYGIEFEGVRHSDRVGKSIKFSKQLQTRERLNGQTRALCGIL